MKVGKLLLFVFFFAIVAVFSTGSFFFFFVNQRLVLIDQSGAGVRKSLIGSPYFYWLLNSQKVWTKGLYDRRPGKFLSHTGLDELPQLVNVIRGEMALFGPRPLPVAEAAKLSKRQQERHKIKPGIMSPWVLEGYHSRPFDEWMESDIDYAKDKSLWYDFVLFRKAVVFVGRLFVREVL